MARPSQWTCVLFDIDGTLVDSADVVVDVFVQTLAHYGRTIPPRSDLRQHVGPPLWESMKDLGFDAATIEDAIDYYRRHYSERFLEPPLFPGIASLLRRLHAAGIPLATATSKQETLAVEQMNYLGLTPYFTAIAGAVADPGSTKETVIRDALARLERQGVDTGAPLLIGDRCFDIEGGHAAGIAVAGVQWGYAQPGELDQAVAIFDTPDSVEAYLLDIRQSTP
ncbi:HAD hydrolase-like protein [Schaalia suimastitidis]|uniref:HAD hydrolase-like protein n=1 Tax=Schaalia suimastitidis TaxID=121163 RepID=UPI0004216804|nr:HAD hydrolase-like protein [Schaalia suimastitidis]